MNSPITPFVLMAAAMGMGSRGWGHHYSQPPRTPDLPRDHEAINQAAIEKRARRNAKRAALGLPPRY